MSFLHLLIILDILGVATAQLLLKKGMMTVGPLNFSLQQIVGLLLSVFKNVYLFGGLVMAGFCVLLWLFILSKVNLSIIYPISTSLTLLLVVVGSSFLFKEGLNWVQLIGVAAIILGIFLVYYRNNI